MVKEYLAEVVGLVLVVLLLGIVVVVVSKEHLECWMKLMSAKLDHEQFLVQKCSTTTQSSITRTTTSIFFNYYRITDTLLHFMKQFI